MINIGTKVINLNINKREVVDTSLFLKQHDNHVLNFEFHVNVTDESELDYSQVSKVLMIIYFQDGTHLDPILCIPDTDKITFLVNNAVLSKVGTVDGFLRLYSSDDQVMTTNSFRFTVDKDVFNNESIVEDVSLLNQAMERFIDFESQENARVLAEDIRIANNTTWTSNQETWSENETTRNTNETTRIANATLASEAETLRKVAELNRASLFSDIQSSYNTMVSENTTFKSNIQSLMIQSYSTNVKSITNPTGNILDRPLFIIPTGLNYIITDVNILSHGECTGITALETCTVELKHSGTNVSTVVFNSLTAFPDVNNAYELEVYNPVIENGNSLTLSITNTDEVITPEFTLQINYKIVEGEIAV